MRKIKIGYVYYSSNDFASSCDPIRVDLVVDGICIKSQSTIQYSEYREVVKDMQNYCDTTYKESKVSHVCVEDGYENYKFIDNSTEGDKNECDCWQMTESGTPAPECHT